jgi:hypothetical protein
MSGGTSRVGPEGMDRPRKPRTIGDLLDDQRFELLLWNPAVLEAHRKGRELIRRATREIEAERELGIRCHPGEAGER